MLTAPYHGHIAAMKEHMSAMCDGKVAYQLIRLVKGQFSIWISFFHYADQNIKLLSQVLDTKKSIEANLLQFLMPCFETFK